VRAESPGRAAIRPSIEDFLPTTPDHRRRHHHGVCSYCGCEAEPAVRALMAERAEAERRRAMEAPAA